MRLVLALALLLACGPTVPPGPATFVVQDVRLFDGENASERRSVLVVDGVISTIGGAELKIPRGVAVIDGSGRTLLPGLIDAHVHLSQDLEADLRQAISLGVTTVLDMWNGSERYERIKAVRASDPPGMASVLTAGQGATVPGGHPSQMGGPPFPTISTPDEAQAFVDARLAEGSDYIKIIYDDLASLGMSVPALDPPTLEALIAAAHARGRLAVVHALSTERAREVIEAGADGMVHLFTEPAAMPGFADTVKSRGAFIIPTLTVSHGLMCGIPHGPDVVSDAVFRPYIRANLRPGMTMSFPPRTGAGKCEGTHQAIRSIVETGGTILAGTDAPVPGQTYGASLHVELEALVSAGLTPVQALTAATAATAKAFRLDDRGRIQPGLRADLLLVDGDPTTSIRATRSIVAIWKRGLRVVRTTYAE
jgi:imidazolonepropionase-like amidohydrolase